MDYILPLSDKVIKVLRGCLEKAKPYTAEERETLNYPEVGEFFIDRLLTDREAATYAMDELKAAGLWTEEDEKKAFG